MTYHQQDPVSSTLLLGPHCLRIQFLNDAGTPMILHSQFIYSVLENLKNGEEEQNSFVMWKFTVCFDFALF